MKKIKLELFLKIIGIGSASGLIFKDNSLFIISDNASVIYEQNLQTNQLQKHPVISIENAPTENIPKKIKPDFEAITSFDNKLYIFGSGSKPNRKAMVEFDPVSKKTIETNLTLLYESIQNFGKINAENFNIEGVIRDENNWYFFNRGNGKTEQNGIFTVSGKNLTEEFSLLYNAFKLPKIKKIRTSFTDAILHDEKIYFLASAENSSSTYLDGEILGTIIGRIDIQKMKIDFTKKISSNQKFEGLTLFRETETELEFLLCEDNDSDVLTAEIYRLTLRKL